MNTERFEHAISLRDAGRLKEALDALAALVESTADPQERAGLILNESACLMNMGSFEDARQRIREAVLIAPTVEVQARADFGCACVSALEGKTDEALDQFDCVLREYAELLATPDHEDLYEETQIRRGPLLAQVGRFREASVVLQECLSFPLDASDEQFVLYNLGSSYLKMGEDDRARQTLLMALQKGLQGTHAVSAHYALGTISFAERAYAKALLDFEWCLAHADEGQIPKQHIYGWLARTAQRLGMKDQAKQYEELFHSSL